MSITLTLMNHTLHKLLPTTAALQSSDSYILVPAKNYPQQKANSLRKRFPTSLSDESCSRLLLHLFSFVASPAVRREEGIFEDFPAGVEKKGRRRGDFGMVRGEWDVGL